jgi:hypothetical protein
VYLYGSVPNLQVGEKVASFMTQHPRLADSPAGDHGEDRHGRRTTRSGPFPTPSHRGDSLRGVATRSTSRVAILAAQAATGRSGWLRAHRAQQYQKVFSET